MKVVTIQHRDGGVRFSKQFCTAILGKPGRVYTPYVIIEFPIRLRRIANGDVTRYTKDMDYPLKKACSRFMGVGRRHGMTKGARKLIKAAQA